MLPLVTIIVTTKNEEKNIEDCYKAVHNQTIPRDKLEIVLIDNNSTDRTKEISKPYVDEIYNVGPERSAQRNYGFEHAKADWVLYLDADMRIEPMVIEECLSTIENDSEVIGIYVPEKVVGEGFWIKVRNFERSFYDATCIDAARFIKKDAFLGIGGFDTSMSGPEDWDLDRRLLEKGKLALIKSHLNHDEGAFSFKTYFGKKKYYAKSFDTYAEKWNNDDMVRKQLGFYYRFIGVFIENGKWKKLISHPFLTFGMYFLRFLVGITFLKSKF